MFRATVINKIGLCYGRLLSKKSSLHFAANVDVNCNFETNFCTWTQDNTDQFDWTRKRGSTSSSSTGPSVDHTTGTCKLLCFCVMFDHWFWQLNYELVRPHLRIPV